MRYPSPPNEKAVLDRFNPRPLYAHQHTRMEQLRAQFIELTKTILGETPPSREQALALTHLEEAAMWANKAITHNEGEADGKQTTGV